MSAPARADGSSLVTLGVGGGIGMHSSSLAGTPKETALVNQANVRFKLLFLGVDYAIDLQHDKKLATPSDDLQYRAKMRLTALLYPYSGDLLAFYLGVGVGGTELAELARLGSQGNSYHGGIGFEVHLTSHLSLDASFMLVAPGIASVKRATVAGIEAAYAKGDVTALQQFEAPGFGDYVSFDNHEIMLRVFLYL